MTKLEEAAKAYAEALAEFHRVMSEYEVLEAQEGEWEARKAKSWANKIDAGERRGEAQRSLLAVAAEWKP